MTDRYSEQSHGQDGDVNTSTEPTIAAFSPNQAAATSTRNRSSILIHQKSPLLIATPPQVTRALAYSHPFILPLNHLAGLLSWTTGDPWESFLLVAAFWFTVLYGDIVLRWTGPILLVAVLILGMYTRRYSPLSSTSWSGEKKHKRAKSVENEQRKSLDEILETLQTFTARCNVLLDPFLRLTDFLSTQTTATAATTRPALTTLFIRILAFLPFWFALTLPPLRVVTTQRIVLVFGTQILSWHSRPARVTRTILWRSKTVRNFTTLLTGLHFKAPAPTQPQRPALKPRVKGVSTTNETKAKGTSPGVRFTFTVYENQRRWLGLGWTASLLAYERQAWTDEHLNTCPDPDHFDLPDTDHDTTKWRWAPSNEWCIEGAATDKEKSAKRIGGGGGGDDCGWTYYDNKWRDGRKTDGWGRYTRRRKWLRDAELVEITSDESSPAPASEADTETTAVADKDADTGSVNSTAKRKGWFAKKRGVSGDKADGTSSLSGNSGSGSGETRESRRSRDGPEEDVHTPVRYRHNEWEREIGEGLAEGLS